jgi:hypothetical protein
MSPNAWRALVSALADDAAREVYARIVLDEPVETVLDTLPPGKRRRVIDTLLSAGLISVHDEGWRMEPDVFREALAAAAPPKPRPTGVDRFFVDGRLGTYPSRVADRDEVHAHIADRLLTPGETLSEREVNDRLADIVDDVAAMRRYLIDTGVLRRERDGTGYSRAR